MKIKANNIEFISFSGGVCDIYYEDDEGVKSYKYKDIGYDNRILGFRRHFAAKKVNVNINKVIRIPLVEGIDNYDKVEIKNIGKYDIELSQIIYDTNPPCIDLTLKEMY